VAGETEVADALPDIKVRMEERAMSTSSENASEPAGQAQRFVVTQPEYDRGNNARASDRWPWVAVAVVAAIGAIAIAVIVTVGKQRRSAGVPTVALVASHPTTVVSQPAPSPKVIIRTVAGPSTTIIREEPVPAAAPAIPTSAAGTCAGGIYVNAQTSCPFAQNVVAQYTRDAEQAGAPGSFNVYAYSPVTNKGYADSCGYSASTGLVSCSHGSDLIQFAYGSR
jgi:hypothetical protein